MRRNYRKKKINWKFTKEMTDKKLSRKYAHTIEFKEERPAKHSKIQLDKF